MLRNVSGGSNSQVIYQEPLRIPLQSLERKVERQITALFNGMRASHIFPAELLDEWALIFENIDFNKTEDLQIDLCSFCVKVIIAEMMKEENKGKIDIQQLTEEFEDQIKAILQDIFPGKDIDKLIDDFEGIVEDEIEDAKKIKESDESLVDSKESLKDDREAYEREIIQKPLAALQEIFMETLEEREKVAESHEGQVDSLVAQTYSVIAETSEIAEEAIANEERLVNEQFNLLNILDNTLNVFK